LCGIWAFFGSEFPFEMRDSCAFINAIEMSPQNLLLLLNPDSSSSNWHIFVVTPTLGMFSIKSSETNKARSSAAKWAWELCNKNDNQISGINVWHDEDSAHHILCLLMFTFANRTHLLLALINCFMLLDLIQWKPLAFHFWLELRRFSVICGRLSMIIVIEFEFLTQNQIKCSFLLSGSSFLLLSWPFTAAAAARILMILVWDSPKQCRIRYAEPTRQSTSSSELIKWFRFVNTSKMFKLINLTAAAAAAA